MKANDAEATRNEAVDAGCIAHDFLLGAARPLPPSADIGREGSPLVKLRNSA